MKLNYYKNLDGVRAIAALLVMFLHFFQYNNIQNDSVFNVFKKMIYKSTVILMKSINYS